MGCHEYGGCVIIQKPTILLRQARKRSGARFASDTGPNISRAENFRPNQLQGRMSNSILQPSKRTQQGKCVAAAHANCPAAWRAWRLRAGGKHGWHWQDKPRDLAVGPRSSLSQWMIAKRLLRSLNLDFFNARSPMHEECP
jgi:hypothetical protein